MVLPDYLRESTGPGPLGYRCHGADSTTGHGRFQSADGVALCMTSGPDLVVALGGGTARAMAHVGVLQALAAEGLEPAGAAGTSFGAIVAALYSLGVPLDEMEAMLTAPRARQVWAQGLDFGLHRLSLVHGRRLERWLDERLYRGATFDDLKRPLAIATTSLETGELQLVREGSIARAVIASCSLPLLFAPVRIGESWLVDGGFVEAVPFQSGLTLGDGLLLGINTGIDTEEAGMVRWLRRVRQRQWARSFSGWSISRRLSSAPGRAFRGLGWAARSYARPQVPPAGAALLRVDPGIAWWDFHRTRQAVDAGRVTAQQWLNAGGLATLQPLRTVEVADEAVSVAVERPG